MSSCIANTRLQDASHASPVCGDLADICVLRIYFRPSDIYFCSVSGKNIFEIFFVFTSNIFLRCKVQPGSPEVYCPVSGYCPHLPISKSPHNRDPNFQPRPVATSHQPRAGAGLRTTLSHVTQFNLSLRWKPKFNLSSRWGNHKSHLKNKITPS